ncbi:MAG TPA: nucleotidyltransferase domain-containing protein [Candidatus Brocadiia bacterium]|nr:nucleotidyltransferase domain-containing protein [Candidatus Brocadiia bacterium]
MIDLPPDQLQEVKAILRKHAPECEVRAFGSRVTGGARKFSDLDLALIGPERLTWSQLFRLREAFEESDLPIVVDVLDWSAIGEDFRGIIAQQYEEVQTGQGCGRKPADVTLQR